MATKIGHQARTLFGQMHDKSSLTRSGHLDRAEAFGDALQAQGIQNIGDVKLKHVMRYMDELKERGLSESTLANYASTIRQVCEKVGKADMIPRTNEAAFGFTRTVEDRMQPVVRSETERAAAEKFAERIEAYGRNDTSWCALAYRMTQEFGLRRQEALKSNQVIERDGKQYLVVEGAKGGRPRQVELVRASQREIISQVQGHISRTGGKSLMPPLMTQAQAKQFYSNVVNRAGGTKDAKLNSQANRHQDMQDAKRSGATAAEIAERSGHGREDVQGHYVP